MRRAELLALALLLSLAPSGCDEPQTGTDGDADSDGDGAVDADGVDPAWVEPDPEGRTTEGDLDEAPPEMVIVTSSALAPAWEAYATHRGLSGLVARVVLLSDALEGGEGRDDAERLRSYLARAHAEGVRFALLGGDADVVPFRRVEDSVSALFMGSFTTDGPTQLYFSDVDADWDADGDGVFGEAGEDVTVEDLRAAELHVGRVPVESPNEVDRYRRKVERFELEPGGREAYPLIMSDVAMSMPIGGDIDAAVALEITIDEVFPEGLAANARRLYATEEAARDYGGEVITRGRAQEAFLEGYSLAFHNGHGSHGYLTNVIDLSFIDVLDNDLAPVMLSCSCLAGNFADVAETGSHLDWRPQGPDEDSVAERFVLHHGGGVAYVGSTGTGLGPLGGSQILHSTLEGLFVAGHATIGEALAYGRAHMREVTLNIMSIDMPISDETERWTQLVTVLLGDPAIRPWTGPARAIEVEAPESYGPGFQELRALVSDGSGAPVEGATVVLLKEGDFLLRGQTDAEGAVTFRFIPNGRAPMTLGASGPGLIAVRREIEPL